MAYNKNKTASCRRHKRGKGMGLRKGQGRINLQEGGGITISDARAQGIDIPDEAILADAVSRVKPNLSAAYAMEGIEATPSVGVGDIIPDLLGIRESNIPSVEETASKMEKIREGRREVAPKLISRRRGGKLKPAEISKDQVNPEELAMGTQHEMEHTTDKATAELTALHHLAEHPDYYTQLGQAGLEDGGDMKGRGITINTRNTGRKPVGRARTKEQMIEGLDPVRDADKIRSIVGESQYDPSLYEDYMANTFPKPYREHVPKETRDKLEEINMRNDRRKPRVINEELAYGGKMKGQDGLNLNTSKAIAGDMAGLMSGIKTQPGLTLGESFLSGNMGFTPKLQESSIGAPTIPDSLGKVDVLGGGLDGNAGGGFGNFLNKYGSTIQSVGSTAANLITASEQPVHQAPVLARHRRTPYKSVLPDIERINAANLSSAFRNFDDTGGGRTAKQAAFATTLGANTSAALGDTQARNQYNSQGDRVEAGVNISNAQAINQVTGRNIDRRRDRLIDMSQAINAGTQDLINIKANKDTVNMRGKEILMEAMKSQDTGVIERFAKELGIPVEELLKTLNDPNANFNQ